MKTVLATLALALTTPATPAAADVAISDNDKTLTVDCATDKNVSIQGNNADVTLNGVCEKVIVAGNKAKVTGSAVEFLVSGNENTLAIDQADKIYVPGNKNTVSYKKAVKAKAPKVAAPGNGNKISREK